MLDGAILQVFISLTVLVVALSGILLTIKKYAKKNKKNSQQKHNIEILSKTSILPKSHLFVVQADDKTLLLGAGENGVNLIADLSESSHEDALERYKPSSTTYKLPTSVNRVALDRRRNMPSNLKSEAPRAARKQPYELSDEELAKSLSFSTFLKSAFSKEN